MKTKTEVETKVQRTKGPWKVEPFQREDGSGFAITTTDEHETVVTWLYQYAPNSFGRMMRSPQNHEANANLIAAAPELLSACEYALKMLHSLDMNTGDKGDQAYQAIEEAIKAAKGI